MKQAVLSRIETGDVMRTETIKGGLPQADGYSGDARADAAGPARNCRALVPVQPTVVTAKPARRAAAPFLAQLIAVKDQHPQTRERRRAEPREALAAYASTAALTRF